MIYSPILCANEDVLKTFFAISSIQSNTITANFSDTLIPLDVSYSEGDHYNILGVSLINHLEQIILMSQHYTLRCLYIIKNQRQNWDYYSECERYSSIYPGIFFGVFDTDLKSEQGQEKIFKFLQYSRPTIVPDYYITNAFSQVSVEAISGTEYNRRKK